MKRRLSNGLSAALAGSALLLVGAALAQTGAGGTGGTGGSGTGSPSMAFKRLDTNQDGKISREEAARATGMSDRFDQMDQDRDGQLSSEEFAAGASKSMSSKPGGTGAAGGAARP